MPESKKKALGILAIAGVEPYKEIPGEEYMSPEQTLHFTKILEANDQLTFDKKRRKVREVSKDPHLNALGWWSGKLVFDSEKMSKVKSGFFMINRF